MATLHLKRESQYANKMRSFEVLMDDNKIGEIKDGEEKEIKLPPGKHLLKLKIDWCYSKTFELDIKEEDAFHFKCGSRLKGWKVLLASVSMDKEDVFVYLERIEK